MHQFSGGRSVVAATNTANVVAVDVEARHPVAIIAIAIGAVGGGTEAPAMIEAAIFTEAMTVMEATTVMEAMAFMEATGFGRRRGGGDTADCDKRGQGEGGHSGLDRHDKTPSGSSGADWPAC